MCGDGSFNIEHTMDSTALDGDPDSEELGHCGHISMKRSKGIPE
jgi:hypothetical protein